MAPDSVGDGDRSMGLCPRRRRRLVKLDGSRVIPSSHKQESSGSLEGKKRKKKKGKGKVMTYDYAGMRYLSSSSDEDEDGYHRKMTIAEIKIYNKQIQASDGFDVDVPPEVDDYGIIHPDPGFATRPKTFEEVKRCSRKAIDVYNKEHNAKYEFMRVLKLGTMGIVGLVHYITFEAKAEGAAPVFFQAIVYVGMSDDDIDVVMIRRKPQS